ncbi:MAG: hypothetical protein RR425_06930 [Erysipelotrichales bacterium]|jgi:hypothetical protein
MKNKSDFIVVLTTIYLALVFLVGIAVYAFIKYFCLDITLATNILIWTATIFATIALLYTFNSWRDQKGSEVIANECTEITKNLSIGYSEFKNICDYPYYMNRDDAIQKLKELKILLNKNKRELYFIRSSIEDDNLELIFSDFIKDELYIYSTLEYCLTNNKEIHLYLDKIKHINNNHLNRYLITVNNLIGILRPYSLYKKDIKFKEDKSA